MFVGIIMMLIATSLITWACLIKNTSTGVNVHWQTAKVVKTEEFEIETDAELLPPPPSEQSTPSTAWVGESRLDHRHARLTSCGPRSEMEGIDEEARLKIMLTDLRWDDDMDLYRDVDGIINSAGPPCNTDTVWGSDAQSEVETLAISEEASIMPSPAGIPRSQGGFASDAQHLFMADQAIGTSGENLLAPESPVSKASSTVSFRISILARGLSAVPVEETSDNESCSDLLDESEPGTTDSTLDNTNNTGNRGISILARGLSAVPRDDTTDDDDSESDESDATDRHIATTLV
jgi:hypothetical protein